MRISDWSSDVCSSDLAQDAARRWFLELHRNGGRKAGVYTVSDALDDYLEGFRGKDLENTRRRIDAIIRPDLGQHRVSKLESKTITDWMNKLASSPARLRTAKGADQNYRRSEEHTSELQSLMRNSYAVLCLK